MRTNAYEKVADEESVAGFARSHDVNQGTFRVWLSRIRRERAENVELVEVEVKGRDPRPQWMELAAGGVVLRFGIGSDPRYVAALVEQLERKC